MTKSGWNRSKYVEAISLRSVARRKKERKKEETSKIQDPAGASGRVTKQKSMISILAVQSIFAGYLWELYVMIHKYKILSSIKIRLLVILYLAKSIYAILRGHCTPNLKLVCFVC